MNNQPPSDRLGHLLQRSARAMRSLLMEALEPYELGPRLQRILAALAEREPLTQQALAEELRIDRSSMVGLADELEYRGHIERQPHPDDRRAYEIRLTAKGRDALEQSAGAVDAAHARFLEPLSESDREQLHALLLRLSEHHKERIAKGMQRHGPFGGRRRRGRRRRR